MKKKILITVLTMLFAIISCTGCALWDNEVNELNGSITGNTYNAGFYTNQGENYSEANLLDLLFNQGPANFRVLRSWIGL